MQSLFRKPIPKSTTSKRNTTVHLDPNTNLDNLSFLEQLSQTAIAKHDNRLYDHVARVYTLRKNVLTAEWIRAWNAEYGVDGVDTSHTQNIAPKRVSIHKLQNESASLITYLKQNYILKDNDLQTIAIYHDRKYGLETGMRNNIRRYLR